MTISGLIEWYRRQCDGDWEHQGGLTLETLDNPGWSLKVVFDGVPHGFTEAIADKSYEATKEDWATYTYHAQADTLTMACGPALLERMIADFLAGSQGGKIR